MTNRQYWGAAAAWRTRSLVLMLGVLSLLCGHLVRAVSTRSPARVLLTGTGGVRQSSAFIAGSGAASRRGARVIALGSEVLRRRGPDTPAPVYDDSQATLVDKALYRFFRNKVVEELGQDVEDAGFNGLMELIRRLNSRYADKARASESSRRILQSLFPSWLPKAFKVMFARPLPGFSAKMNAYITKLTTHWLMGPSELMETIEVDGGAMAQWQGLKVERCRYLEEAKCASVCVNTCKVPTETFFMLDMGIPLTMTPNHDDFSCEFAFGRTPPPREEDPSFQVDCFAQCPTAKKRPTGQPLCYQIDVMPKALADKKDAAQE